MRILRIDHLHFFTTDLDKCIGFYEDLGFTLARRVEHGGREAAQLVAAGVTLDLNETRASDNPGYSHFAVQVDDLDDACVKLRDRGYDVDGPTYNQDTKRWVLTVRDPNGFLVQMVKTDKWVQQG
jgi:catechol 2,3-dioxygenase-like lactoylglutathione lyase family enzyme